MASLGGCLLANPSTTWTGSGGSHGNLTTQETEVQKVKVILNYILSLRSVRATGDSVFQGKILNCIFPR